jgi:SAM-dependent methyltransferase
VAVLEAFAMSAAPGHRLALHEVLGLLGVGDIHPGGPAATDFLLRELDRAAPRRVLEVGAGIGLTTQRLLQRGWRVTAIEPNPVLRRVLEKRLACRAYPDTFESFDDAELYDAVIAESVFYRLNIEQAFARAYRLLRPGGQLALVDRVWTDAARPDVVASLAGKAERIYGIPAMSVEPLTWTDWRRTLAAAGFAEVAAERVPEHPRGPRQRRTILLNGARHPLALVRYLSYRRATHAATALSGWVESWMSVWRRT